MDEQPPPSRRMTLLEQREIEGKIVAPLIQAVREELGDERTMALLRRVVEGLAHDSGAELARSGVAEGLIGFARTLDRWTEGGALEIELLEQSAERLDFNVTRCRYAEMYHRLGLGTLGASLSCCRDAALASGFDPEIKLSRSQTILEGAPFCDFRFRRASSNGPNQIESPTTPDSCNSEGGVEP
ncbi:L-2-amino-thiazoline-4-carboxylic acid hydrolase [Tautonia marina]|uniref:L-2-amino-thiazoline-4-carboxylic acid hydrolase n=1 Tax=Tautonia marina TaxID=2653855 RepID=UPI001260AA76|nr:L-2-amino-thiazoline-4-carboxylic acid hydrolase [Tautonia marina]